MTTSNLLAFLALLLGGGGGAAFIAKATRLVVAVEELAKAVKAARDDIAGIVTTVQGHETRIAHVEGQLQQPAAVAVVPVAAPAATLAPGRPPATP